MQKKHLIGAGITAFSVILGLLWLIPLIWLIGTAFSVPSFHMTLFPTTAFTLDNIKYSGFQGTGAGICCDLYADHYPK